MKINAIVLFLVSCSVLCSPVFSEKFTEDFENDGNLKKWEIEGDAKTSVEQFHSGEKSLKLLPGAKAAWIVSKDNKPGKVTLWIFDTNAKMKPGKQQKVTIGGRWGIVNADGDIFALEIGWHQFLDGNLSYPWFDSAAQFDHLYSGVKRKQGWNKWEFDFSSDKSRKVVMNGDTEAKISWENVFTGGFSGISFEAKDEKAGPLYVDDIEVEIIK